MPRKFITPEVKDQNRESQRRSRARRKELIDDLKRQLEDYQRRGISASLEMQQAARAVNMENQRLRNLLQLHGVSSEEIHRHLSPPSLPSELQINSTTAGLGQDDPKCQTCGSILLEPTLALAAMWNGKTPDTQGSRQSTAEPALESVFSPASSSGYTHHSNPVERPSSRALSEGSRSTPAPLLPVRLRDQAPEERTKFSDDHQSRSRISISSLCDNTPNSNTSSSTDALPPISDYFSPPNPSPQISRTKPLESSCDTAAAILMDLHGHADADQARAALGCHGIGDCSVKNTRIFQLMDRLS